ncbi:alpha/beta hydrolase [Acinetobacter sp.]|jgi:pimeloyl-ACP methyl ester carboxylesterase|uniref:alpha/beta fold hydrolase n=1 Tax=Acinetobacter sp. TaxID=472 RepID=UPI00333EDE9A
MNLIFLPGASGSTEFWQPVMHNLPVNHQKTVLAYPSFGGSPDHPDIQSFEDLQDYVIAQIQHPSIVIAQSMGGIFAVQAALQKPQQIAALVLVATSGGIDLAPFHVADWRKDYQQTFAVPSWFVDHQSYMDELLSQISCPVLLIWGDSDPISPLKVGEYLHEKIGNSTLHVVAQGEHDLAYVFAHSVSALIENFISEYQSVQHKK